MQLKWHMDSLDPSERMCSSWTGALRNHIRLNHGQTGLDADRLGLYVRIFLARVFYPDECKRDILLETNRPSCQGHSSSKQQHNIGKIGKCCPLLYVIYKEETRACLYIVSHVVILQVCDNWIFRLLLRLRRAKIDTKRELVCFQPFADLLRSSRGVYTSETSSFGARSLASFCCHNFDRQKLIHVGSSSAKAEGRLSATLLMEPELVPCTKKDHIHRAAVAKTSACPLVCCKSLCSPSRFCMGSRGAAGCRSNKVSKRP